MGQLKSSRPRIIVNFSKKIEHLSVAVFYLSRFFRRRLMQFLTALLLLWSSAISYAAASDDERIREILEQLLQTKTAEKDQKIAQLEARIKKMEIMLQAKIPDQSEPLDEKQMSDNREKPENSIVSKLTAQVTQIQEAVSQQGLDITGFFDVSARTENKAEQTFNLGAFEIDLEYAYDEHFAVSSALVWDGNSAEIGVAVVDFHLFNDGIPARGRIFSNQGFHIQAGRFDLPFSSDYQFFAAPDRITVSAPLTTERIQQGGYNGDGLRFYGSQDVFNYAVFWTNSVYEDQGMSIGGRAGVSLGNNPFRLHHHDSPSILELGLSYLSDLDGNQNIRRSVYAGDLSFNYKAVSLLSELAWLDSHEDLIDGNGTNFGRNNQLAYHVTLLTELESFVHYPIHAYVRYDNWRTDAAVVLDSDDDTITYTVGDINRLTIGFNYLINDYLQIKFEYTDTLDSTSSEPDFENQLGTTQLVVAF